MSEIQPNLFWNSGLNSLIIGNSGSYTNPIDASMVLGGSQNVGSGIYPLKISLNQGNFFVLTKDGKVAINTPSFPVYESSPNFHMVGRCAVFEGTCGAGGVALTLYNNPDVVPQVGSIAGSLNLSARNNNRNVVNFAQVQSKILNPLKGQSRGQFVVNVESSGTPKTIVKLDDSVNQIGINTVDNAAYTSVLGSGNLLSYVNNSKVIGDGNFANRSNNLYLLGSDNSIDLIKNSVVYTFGRLTGETITSPNELQGLDWLEIDIVDGDIIKIENNLTYNGYYVAHTGVWTKVDDSVAVAYVGTSNILIGSDNELSGNSVIAIGNESAASGNNLYMFGSYNQIKTQKLSGILNTNSVLDSSFVVGSYNSIDASGIIVFGSHNASSGVSAIVLNGSKNIVNSGSLDSIIIGNDNTIKSVSGILLGSSNTGYEYLSSIIGNNNAFNLADSNLHGSRVFASGTQNNLFGNDISSTGNNNLVLGSDINNLGQFNIVQGSSDTVVGNSGIVIGNSSQVFGTNVVSIGSNITASGASSTVIGNNIDAQNISNTIVHGNNNILASGLFENSNVVGQNNVLASGIKNTKVFGDNNRSLNIYNFAIDYSQAILGDSIFSVKINKAEADLFRVGDVVTVKDSGINFIVENKLTLANNEDQIALEFNTSIPSGLRNNTIYLKSTTLQDEIIHNYSNPNIVFGNANELVGMSGLVVGNLNAVSGNNIYNISHSSRINGNDIINIGSKLISNSGSDAVNIGFGYTGDLNKSINIGFGNQGQDVSNIQVGRENIGIHSSIIGSGNILRDNNYYVLGDNNTAVGYGSAYYLGNVDLLVSSGVYDSTLDAVILSTNSTRIYAVPQKALSQKLAVEISISGVSKPAYFGYPTLFRGDSVSFGRFGQNYGTVNNPQVDEFNKVTLQEYIKTLFPDVIPDDIVIITYPVTDSNKTIIGQNNTITEGRNLSIFGNNNVFGEKIESQRLAATSGIVLGNNNTVSKPYSVNPQTGALNWRYPVSEGFKGVIGFDINNTDPNSMHFGYSSNTFKLFDLGGRKDTTVSVVTDPFTVPPTTEEVQKEKVGSSAFNRGLLVNSNYLSDNVFAMLGGSENYEPVFLASVNGATNRVGINTASPRSTLDVSGTISTDTLNSLNAKFDKLLIPKNAAPGYFLTAKDSTGEVEWKYGLKIDFSGLPGTLMYWSGSSLTDGKIQPMSQLVKSAKNNTVPLNQVIYDPSGCVIAKSGLIFDQYLWCDKFSIMALDGLRRNTLAEILTAIEDDGNINPERLGYAQKLIDYARALNKTEESYFVPFSANVLYFVPELMSREYKSNIGDTVYSSRIASAGYNKEGMFVIGRRDNAAPTPQSAQPDPSYEDTNTNGGFSAGAFPNAMTAPQYILSTIPKKNISNKRVHYKFNRKEMTYYTEMLHGANSVVNTELGAYLKPLESSADVRGWWDEATAPSDATVAGGSDTDLDRAVPTAFNMGMQEIDFVIYGTGAKYKSADTVDVPKFVFGAESEYTNWALSPDYPVDLPCVMKTPAFYYNASINSFMMHTLKPSWIPVPIPGDQCQPCNPKESGVWFADLTVRGWIGTSGIRIGTGLTRQVEVDPEDPTKVREMVDAKGNPLFRSTRGMYLRSDKYGFAVWDEGPDGVSRSSNDIIMVPESTESTLVEGSLDPLIDIANFPLETTDIYSSARLLRDTLTVKSDAEAPGSASFRIRGVTRNTLLFAQNPLPNTYYRTGKTNNFNEAPYQNDNNSINESTLDGTENLFYYGYSNALAGLLYYNNSLQKTEILVDGDATRRIKVGDVLRLVIYYKPENYVDGQPYPQKILKIPVIGVNAVWLNGQKTTTSKTLQTQVVLAEKLDIDQATYSLDASNQLRQVALMSENVGGYLTFNFPGATPEIVLSNREGVHNLFNTYGKKIDFAVYGAFKSTRPDPSLLVDSISNSVNINTAKSNTYGTYKKSITFNSNLLAAYKLDINSPIYYNYGWQNKYLLGTVEETPDLLKITGSSDPSLIDFSIGDVIEIIYDQSQKIIGQIITKTINPGSAGAASGWDIRVSLTSVNTGLVDNVIGNIQRVKDKDGNDTSAIVNTNVKIKTIKRQLNLSSVDGANNTSLTKAEGNIPLLASLSVRGLTYTDGLMLSERDANNQVIVPHNSVLFNRHGMVFGSNLRFFTYDDLLVDNKKNQHLLYNTDVPAVIATGVVSSKINGHVPVFADTTLKGSTKIENLHIDHLVSFDTIDGGEVVFGGKCNGPELNCA